ncbi:hypothetical protein F4809DRAFT_615561 [Biscogniauxia mediterranea]|nr:hypothetical protein F4809DRAFT_615561 [Biscogniauxia mediterranea]
MPKTYVCRYLGSQCIIPNKINAQIFFSTLDRFARFSPFAFLFLLSARLGTEDWIYAIYVFVSVLSHLEGFSLSLFSLTLLIAGRFYFYRFSLPNVNWPFYLLSFSTSDKHV